MLFVVKECALRSRKFHYGERAVRVGVRGAAAVYHGQRLRRCGRDYRRQRYAVGARRVLRLGCDRVRQCRAAKLQRRAQRSRRGDVCVGHEGHEVLPRSQRHAGRAGGRDAAGGVDGVRGERQRAADRDCLRVGVVEHSVFICRRRPGRPLRASCTCCARCSSRAGSSGFTALALRSLWSDRPLNALRAS